MNKKSGLDMTIKTMKRKTGQADSHEDTTKRSRIDNLTIQRFQEKLKKYRQNLLANTKFIEKLETAILIGIKTRLHVLGRYKQLWEFSDIVNANLWEMELARDEILWDLDPNNYDFENPVFIDERELELQKIDEGIREAREHVTEMEWGLKNTRNTTTMVEEILKPRKARHEAINARLCQEIATIERHLMSQSGTNKLYENEQEKKRK